MAEDVSSTKVEKINSGEEQETQSDELLSLESLDSIIASEDPEFAKSLDGIGPDENVEIYNESLQAEYTLEDEVKQWKDASSARKKWAAVFPFLPLLSFKIKMKRTELRLKSVRWKEQAVYRIKNAGPLLLAWSRETIQDGLHAFVQYSLLKKLTFFGLLALTGLGGVVVYRIVTKGLFPPPAELFVGSLAEWSHQQYEYDIHSEMESFYESPRTAQNFFLMKKMIVNLLRSANSGNNPMAAMELLVEGAANDVIVEIKDREYEVQDLFLRTIEGMTYDQVATGEGKKHLCEMLRKQVNLILTKGFVKQIFIKTIVVKP
ncbi:MAG: flagellar basal body-associated FliL family protein [Pseudobdellovibrionaceae bacterium]